MHNSNYINIKRNPSTLKKPYKEESSFTHIIIMHRISMELPPLEITSASLSTIDDSKWPI